MKRVYQVRYESNPNLPIGYDHTGKLYNLVSESTRTFSNLDDAITFWSECTSPITKLKDFKKALCECCCLTEKEAEEVLSICEEEVFVDGDLEYLPQSKLELADTSEYL